MQKVKVPCATRRSETGKRRYYYMYAIIQTGGKQYKVEKDLKLKVEKLDVESGTVKLDVLMIVDGDKVTVGNPIAGAYAEAEVLGSGKGDKIIVYKYKAKKNERRRQGHRQPYTLIKVNSIVAG